MSGLFDLISDRSHALSVDFLCAEHRERHQRGAAQRYNARKEEANGKA